MPCAAGRSFHDDRCAVTCNAAYGRRASEAVDRYSADCASLDRRPGNATFYSTFARKDETGHGGSPNGRWPVLYRNPSQGPVPRRHSRVGKPRFQGLPFRRNAKLRNHEERRVYV